MKSVLSSTSFFCPCATTKVSLVNNYTKENKGTLCGVIVSKLDYQSIVQELDSYWGAHISDLAPYLSSVNDYEYYFMKIGL